MIYFEIIVIVRSAIDIYITKKLFSIKIIDTDRCAIEMDLNIKVLVLVRKHTHYSFCGCNGHKC
jgi:hypothetical protein